VRLAVNEVFFFRQDRLPGCKPVAAIDEVFFFRQARIISQPAERVSWPQAPGGEFIRRMVGTQVAASGLRPGSRRMPTPSLLRAPPNPPCGLGEHPGLMKK